MVILTFPLLTGQAESPLRIGRIFIDRREIFATGTAKDHQFPYSWANKLHIVTKERFIRQEILFKEGDLFSAEILEESERMLRQRLVFRAVSILPEQPQDGSVDVLIQTDDVWSTSLQLAYEVAGGKNFYRVGILEHNFLGLGKEAGAFIRQDIDRFVKGVSYSDPHLLGSRAELFGGYGEDEEGKEWEFGLQKPYYSSLTRHSEGVNYLQSEDEDRLFENGQEVAFFHRESVAFRIFTSYALHPSLLRQRRVKLAYEKRDEQFSDFRIFNNSPPPESRILSFILLGYEYKNNRFIKENGINTFDRVEDVNLGGEWDVEAGPSLESLGATRDGIVGRVQVRKIWSPWRRLYLMAHTQGDGRYEEDQITDATLRFNGRITAVNWRPGNTVFLRSEVRLGKNLDEEGQFLLGGENGLRAYSVRQFAGPKKILFNLENRQAVLYDWFHLVNVGWAVFADTGAVWEEGGPLRGKDFKSDLGFGIRFSPSRSTDPSIVRADLAYALDENNRSSRWVFNVGADFSFNLQKDRKFDQ